MQLVFRATAGGRVDRAWNAMIDANPVGWFWSRTEWIDFQLARFPKAIDLSHAVVDGNGKVVAACPMILNDGVVGLGDWPAPMPISLFTADPRVQGPAVGAMVVEAAESLRVYHPKLFRFCVWPGAVLAGPEMRGAIGQFVATMQRNGAKDRSWDTQVIDLTKGYDILHGECRKSYRHILKDAADRIKRENERVRAEAERKIQAAAKEAGVVVSKPAVVFTPPPPPVPKAQGVAFTDTWKFESVDPALVPAEYKVVDEKRVGAVVRALKGETQIPGVRVYVERGVRA